MIPIHTGKVEQGKLILFNHQKYLAQVLKLEGKEIELTVRQKKKQRSNDANRYYWGVIVEIISEHIGYDREETHFNLKLKFASQPDAEKDGMVRAKSTADMDTKEFSQYCDSIKRWAAEFLGVYIPDPGECEYREGV